MSISIRGVVKEYVREQAAYGIAMAYFKSHKSDFDSDTYEAIMDYLSGADALSEQSYFDTLKGMMTPDKIGRNRGELLKIRGELDRELGRFDVKSATGYVFDKAFDAESILRDRLGMGEETTKRIADRVTAILANGESAEAQREAMRTAIAYKNSKLKKEGDYMDNILNDLQSGFNLPGRAAIIINQTYQSAGLASPENIELKGLHGNFSKLVTSAEQEIQFNAEQYIDNAQKTIDEAPISHRAEIGKGKGCVGISA